MQTVPPIDPTSGLEFIFWVLIDIPRLIYLEWRAGTLFSPESPAVFFVDFYRSLVFFSTIITLLFLYGCIYCYVKLWKLEAEKVYKLKHPESHAALEVATPHEEIKVGGLKWQVVEKHINSANPGDWRLAVLEADILLDDMVRGFGYPGINLGERLKSASKASFATLDQAWEAHKIRNAIAHEGAGFELGEREARRVINLYRAVFEEFNYI
ncbi:hypothetical protein K8Q93_01785 [Candidatus Parcubacteria bacterium]|nr:hypothetical protein [Candidatus Parcubacteria bacterium]